MIAALAGKALAAFMPYKFIAIILALVAGVAFIDRRATYRERAKCTAAKIESQLKTARADLEAERNARVEDQRATAELAAAAKAVEAENESLRARFKDRCVATPDDIKRLR